MLRAALITLTLLAGCSFTQQPDAPPAEPRIPTTTSDQTPRLEPRSRYGNPASYVEFGKRYHVRSSADGYRERGIASWYGKKFHGRRTSSGEPYDMYAMTAAHKTLPLPTWVEVRNLKNDRRIIVKVNDRGPFVANRIIDLSFEAAQRLDIVQNGTGLVEVRALEFDAAGNVRDSQPIVSAPATVVRHAEPAPRTDEPTAAVAAPAEPAAAAGAKSDATAVRAARLYAQVGAFGSLDNAEGMFIRLREVGFAPLDIVTLPDETPPLYRVRVGPVGDADTLDATVERLRGQGIDAVQVVIE